MRSDHLTVSYKLAAEKSDFDGNKYLIQIWEKSPKTI